MQGGAYAAFNVNVINQIHKAEADSVITIHTDLWVSFTRLVMESLVARNDLTFELTYKLQGKTYAITIPAGATVPTDVDYAGFGGYLADLYGKTEIEQ